MKLTLLFLLLFVFACQKQEQTAVDPTTPIDTVVHLPSLFEPLDSIALPENLSTAQQEFGDLDSMLARRQIRVLVPPSRLFYYFDGVEQKGLTFEILLQFETWLEKRKGVEINLVFIPSSRDKLFSYLLAGRGDLAAANLTITPEREKHLLFSLPIFDNARELLVYNATLDSIELQTLVEKGVYLQYSSSYLEHLHTFNDSLSTSGQDTIPVYLIDELLSLDDIVHMVSDNVYPLTILDEHVAQAWSQVDSNLRINHQIVFSKNGAIGWAMSKEATDLKREVDLFMEEYRIGTLIGNVLVERYFTSPDQLEAGAGEVARERFEAVWPLAEKFARQYGLDPLLLVAQGYQESFLDQTQVSPAGAIGVMQVMPATARDPYINIPDIHLLENNIHAGAKMMGWIKNNYFNEPEVDSLNRLFFTLAAYNAGPSRISRLRLAAPQYDINPNVWFGEMELLVGREVSQEPVTYVSNTYRYYLSFAEYYEFLQVKYPDVKRRQSN